MDVNLSEMVSGREGRERKRERDIHLLDIDKVRSIDNFDKVAYGKDV